MNIDNLLQQKREIQHHFITDTLSDYSNWIIPKKIMCGPYPYCDGINFDEKSGLDNMLNLLKDGVDTFVCLCMELPDTTKEFEGQISHPYFPNYKHYTNLLNKIKPNCTFIYIPIADGNCPKPKELLAHLSLLLKLYNDNKVMYIHCAGGHGRTNIYTSLLINILYGLEPEKAIDYVFSMRMNRRMKDKKLEIYKIPKDDRKYVFNKNQESIVIKIAHYLEISRNIKSK